MISRVTIYSLLLALMVAVVIYGWSGTVRDRCSTYPDGGVPPRSEYVLSGTHQVEISCGNWWMRQPEPVQILCIVEGALGLLFLLNALQDLRGWLTWRRAMRAERT